MSPEPASTAFDLLDSGPVLAFDSDLAVAVTARGNTFTLWHVYDTATTIGAARITAMTRYPDDDSVAAAQAAAADAIAGYRDTIGA